MKKKRRTHSAEFKARVGLEALKGVKTVSEIAREHKVHPVQVGQWKKELAEHLPEIFGRKPAFDEERAEKQEERLHAKIGQLSVEIDWLKKKCKQLGIPVDDAQ
jgi:transposase